MAYSQERAPRFAQLEAALFNGQQLPPLVKSKNRTFEKGRDWRRWRTSIV